MNKFKDFNCLETKWKVLIIIGIISLIIMIGLIIFIIIVFKTDLIPYDVLLGSHTESTNIDEYNDFFNELEELEELEVKDELDLENLDVNELIGKF